MAMSGVKCDDAILDAFNKQRLRKTYKQIVYKMSDDKKKVMMERSDNDDWETFCQNLPADDCRYATFDYHLEKDGRKHDKILFVFWSPDAAPTRSKMLYAATKDELRRKLEGIAFEVQGNDLGDMDKTEIETKILKSDK